VEYRQRLVEKGSYQANARMEKARRRKRHYVRNDRGKRQNVAILKLAMKKGEN